MDHEGAIESSQLSSAGIGKARYAHGFPRKGCGAIHPERIGHCLVNRENAVRKGYLWSAKANSNASVLALSRAT
jgi:hypothetical protein